jgi:hypothetical protein
MEYEDEDEEYDDIDREHVAQLHDEQLGVSFALIQAVLAYRHALLPSTPDEHVERFDALSAALDEVDAQEMDQRFTFVLIAALSRLTCEGLGDDYVIEELSRAFSIVETMTETVPT